MGKNMTSPRIWSQRPSQRGTNVSDEFSQYKVKKQKTGNHGDTAGEEDEFNAFKTGESGVSGNELFDNLDALPEEPGFLSKLPRNIAIGLTHLGRNVHNLPHDITKGVESGS